MSEDDRAAKAARARAMLKKRQQQKTVGPSTTGDSRLASPSPPPSRPFTPADAESHSPVQPTTNGRDAGELFSSNGHAGGPVDTHWLTGLERVDTPQTPSLPSPPQSALASPPIPSAPSARSPSSANHGPIASPRPVHAGPTSPLALSAITDTEVNELRARVAEQVKVISSLEGEKKSLEAAAERLKQVESQLQQTSDVLRSERSKTEKLQGFLEHAESDVEQLTNQLEEQKARMATLESDKNSTARHLQTAKT
ncbi:uncharacterized protein PHACADRAFT_190627, partial [Phanerochaete carnosa HHB-10118-sp]